MTETERHAESHGFWVEAGHLYDAVGIAEGVEESVRRVGSQMDNAQD